MSSEFTAFATAVGAPVLAFTINLTLRTVNKLPLPTAADLVLVLVTLDFAIIMDSDSLGVLVNYDPVREEISAAFGLSAMVGLLFWILCVLLFERKVLQSHFSNQTPQSSFTRIFKTGGPFLFSWLLACIMLFSHIVVFSGRGVAWLV